MSGSVLSQIEDTIEQLSLPEQLELMAWLAQTVRRQTLMSDEGPDDRLAAMANDPDIQRELTAIQAEFARTEMDGMGDL